MTFDNHVNLLIGTVQIPPSPSTTGHTLTLMPGDVDGFDIDMPVTLCPPNTQPNRDNAEIAYLTGIDGSELTLTRATEGTTAMQVAAGWQVIGSMTVKTITDIETAVTNKVELVVGKGLSTEDYLTAEKTKARRHRVWGRSELV